MRHVALAERQHARIMGRRFGAALFIRSLESPVLPDPNEQRPEGSPPVVSRHILRGQHEDRAKIIYVGTCRAGCDEVADRVEK